MRTIHSSPPPRILKEVLFRRTENDLGDLRHSPIGTQCGVTEDRNHMVFIREGAEPSIRSGYGWIGEEYPPDRWNYEVPRSHLAFVVLMSTSAIWFNLRGSNHSLPLIAKYREIWGKYSLPLCMKHCFIWCLHVDLMTNLRINKLREI